MPARKRKITLNDDWRDKIRATQIMNRLLGHVEGEIDLSATQVAAARILLGKIVPDLQSAEHKVSGELVHELRWRIASS